MMNIRTELAKSFTHIANFTKLTTTPPLRHSAYLTDWRCSFYRLSEEEMPRSSGGISVVKWAAVTVIYDKEQIPQRGDRLEDLRLYRTRAQVKEKLTVVDVLPYKLENTYLLLLSEDGSK
jgi:hypothetical protein